MEVDPASRGPFVPPDWVRPPAPPSTPYPARPTSPFSPELQGRALECLAGGCPDAADPFERLHKLATADTRRELLSNMSAYLPLEVVESYIAQFAPESEATCAVREVVDRFLRKTMLPRDGATKVPFRFGSFMKEEPEVFNRISGALILAERDESLLVIGNGGAGVAGFLVYLANEPGLREITIVWNGGNSDVNFKAMAYLHGAITYEPHIEMKMGLTALNGRPLPVFINKLALCIPQGDPLRLQSTFREMEMRGDLDAANMYTNATHEKIMAALWKCADDAGLMSLPTPDSFWYGSRYNHSAIGEHDNAMWVLGSAWRTKKMIRGGAARLTPNEVIVRTDQRVDTWTSRVVARLPTWYPPSILEASIKYSLYHLNDTAFLIANSDQVYDVLRHADAEGTPVVIDNPAHLWWSDSEKVTAAKLMVEMLLRDQEFINRWDALVRSGDAYLPRGTPRLQLPAFEYPDPKRNYAEEYMSLVHNVQKASGSYNILEWVHLNYADAIYAKVEEHSDEGGAKTYRVNKKTTHRDEVGALVNGLLESKLTRLPAILVQIAEYFAAGGGGAANAGGDGGAAAAKRAR